MEEHEDPTEIENIPIGLATLDQLMEFLHNRKFGEPVILMRLEANQIVFDHCTASIIRKAGRSLIQFGKGLDREE